MAEKKRPATRKAQRHSRAKSLPPARASPAASIPSDHHTPSTEGRSSPVEPLDVEDLLTELLDRVISESVRAAIERQRVPYAVSRLRDAILYVVEWRFLARDEGDPDPARDPDRERARAWREDEEPQPCALDTWAQGVVPVQQVPPSLGEVPSQESPVTDEASSERSLRARDAVTVPAVRLSRGEVPAAKPPSQDAPAAAGAPRACPGQVRGAVPTLPVPGPPRPQPPTAPRLPDRDPRPSRSPRPRPAPLGTPRPPAPRPAEPADTPARGEPRGSRGAGAGVGDQEPAPPPSARASLGSLRPGRPPRGPGAAPEGSGPAPGVARPGVRRGSPRVRPQVKVLDVFVEPERPRPRRAPRASRGPETGGPRGRPPPQPPPGPPSPEPLPCDPWLSSAPLAPGVTLRCGGSERRGPGTTGHEEEEDEEEEEGEVSKSERELRPILSVPAFRRAWDGER